MVMKKYLLLFLCIAFIANVYAQTTAQDWTKIDCNGNKHHLYADLEAGKAVVLFFYMPNCGSCPPPAKKIQSMVSNVLKKYPDRVAGYVFPYKNAIQCPDVSSWVSGNGLSFFTPLDSGVSQLAYYGGFGMPTVVLLGGKNHRVMFSDVGFTNEDTTIMRDSMMAMLDATASIYDKPETIADFSVYPNPATNEINISFILKTQASTSVEIIDLLGRPVGVVLPEANGSGSISARFNTSKLPAGNYFLRIRVGEAVFTRGVQISR